MKTSDNSWIVNILIFAVIALIIVAGFVTSRLTETTTGKITNVQFDRDDDPDTEIYYTYTVNGSDYTDRAEKDGDLRRTFQNGMTVTVCHNYYLPSNSDVFPAGHKC
jgi:hypothetical protein